MGEKKLSDGKTIDGKGRLTDAIISKLTTFYGNAIRANSHNVNEMRQAVWAVWAHTSSTDDEPKHWFCPKGKNSWCKYNVSVHNNTVNEFSHKNTLPKAVSEVIKPVFKDLSHLKLLRRSVVARLWNRLLRNSCSWQQDEGCPAKQYVIGFMNFCIPLTPRHRNGLLNIEIGSNMNGAKCCFLALYEIIPHSFVKGQYRRDWNQHRRTSAYHSENRPHVIPYAGAIEIPEILITYSGWSDEAHFWLNGYVNKQNCRIWSEANPQVYVETPLHPGKLTVWCALWAGGVLLQKR
ncbi:uncharacterized protein TNCV_1924331 [Trichonephila clavipes]|nr:uncharacterized protein TNCV_1924331 [Trichonephila clavipes]